jgi:hypothetical protein
MKNLEHHIKSNIEQREIQPSDHAWFKVVEGLEQSPQPNKRRYFYFVAGLAAGLALFFTIQVLWFPSSGTSNSQPIKLVTPSSTLDVDRRNIWAASSKLKSQEVLIISQLPKSKPISLSASIQLAIPNQEQTSDQPQTTTQLAASLLAEIELELQEQLAFKPIHKPTEVDRLLALAKAQLEPHQRKLMSHITPEVLLAEVDAQIEDDNFRDKVWAAIKLKFNQVQHALTQR